METKISKKKKGRRIQTGFLRLVLSDTSKYSVIKGCQGSHVLPWDHEKSIPWTHRQRLVWWDIFGGNLPLGFQCPISGHPALGKNASVSSSRPTPRPVSRVPVSCSSLVLWSPCSLLQAHAAARLARWHVFPDKREKMHEQTGWVQVTERGKALLCSPGVMTSQLPKLSWASDGSTP